MILNVTNRITLLGILPVQGDFLTLKIVRTLREELSFSEEEIKALNLQQREGNQVTWDMTAEPNKDVQIGEKATDIVVAALKALDEKKQLTQQHYELYEAFCVKKE